MQQSQTPHLVRKFHHSHPRGNHGRRHQTLLLQNGNRVSEKRISRAFITCDRASLRRSHLPEQGMTWPVLEHVLRASLKGVEQGFQLTTQLFLALLYLQQHHNCPHITPLLTQPPSPITSSWAITTTPRMTVLRQEQVKQEAVGESRMSNRDCKMNLSGTTAAAEHTTRPHLNLMRTPKIDPWQLEHQQLFLRPLSLGMDLKLFHIHKDITADILLIYHKVVWGCLVPL